MIDPHEVDRRIEHQERLVPRANVAVCRSHESLYTGSQAGTTAFVTQTRHGGDLSAASRIPPFAAASPGLEYMRDATLRIGRDRPEGAHESASSWPLRNHACANAARLAASPVARLSRWPSMMNAGFMTLIKSGSTVTEPTI